VFAVVEETLAPASVDIEYDRVVREDIELFRRQAGSFMAGQITDAQFRAFRLRRGVYGQRQAGVQMIRTKIPGGMLTARQMETLAEVADTWGGGKSHLTTRQNVQFHFVPLPQVADLLHRLADDRMTTREACYNTVRNVTCDPLAGLLPDEPFDVRPYAQRVAFAFLHKELTDNLPRKFKISFARNDADDMKGGMHDIGLVPRLRLENGVKQRGFRMVVGGGLGPLPCEAKLLDEFVPVERLVNRIEAVIRLFNQHGNRKNKNTARLKFVLRERGFEWVREQIEREYASILTNGGIDPPEEVPEGFGGFLAEPPAPGTGALLPVLGSTSADPEYQEWRRTNVREQKAGGYHVVTVKIEQGNLTSEQMRAMSRLAADAADGLIRVTIDQNLVLAYVRAANLGRVYAALRQAELGASGVHEISDVTTCPGAYSCNLALTKSMNLGAALTAEVRAFWNDPVVRGLTIKVSGCPNSCGQHWISDFGFYGNSRKIDGREIPYYQMLLGGGEDSEGILRYGVAIQSVPARFAPEAVRRVLEHYKSDRREGEKFREYVLRNRVEKFRELISDLVKPAELFPELYRDWGDDVDFSLQLGRGECAA
jgi:sulfite reductase beta subunit-like hemoprotein